jgi:exonuclease SbcC
VNPLTLHATNVRTFAELDLAVPNGCVVIGGENGAGKSTILNLIDVALFAGRGELAPLLTLGEDELTVELRFEHGGELYRVRRSYSAKGRGKTTFDLEQWAGAPLHTGDDEGPRWEPLTRETADQTQQLLEQILGLSRATFRASSFLAQGDGAAFTEASPRDRKQILAEILGLDIWDRLLTLVRTDLRAEQDATLLSRGRISTLQEEAAGAETVRLQLAEARYALADATGRQAAAAAKLDEAQKRLAGNAAAVERARAAAAEHAAATAAFEQAKEAYSRAVRAGHDCEARQAELDEASTVAAGAPALEQALDDARQAAQLAGRREELLAEASQHRAARARIVEQADKLAAYAEALAGKADHLDEHIGEAGECDRCGQRLGAEAAARAAASFRSDALTARAQIEKLLQDAEIAAAAGADASARADAIEVAEIVEPVEELERRLRVARAAGELRATLAEQVRQLAELAATSDKLAVVFERANGVRDQTGRAASDARALVVDDSSLPRAVEVARVVASGCAAEVEQHRAALVRLEVAEQRTADAVAELTRLEAELQQSDRRIDVLKLAERAFGRDGIPALIVENAAIPQLELEANRILGELGGNTAGCRIELRTQRALKTTDALRDTLDIVIVTPAGERAYETFSGGERTRLNLALRIALARLLAHRRGAESRLLAIDEPDGLDAQGMDALASILSRLGGDFEKVLVVSHQPQLATSFDQAIVIVNDGGGSRIEFGAPEAVAA